MKWILLIFACGQFAAVAAHGEMPTAEQVMKEARAKATAEHKAIFLHFGAQLSPGFRREGS